MSRINYKEGDLVGGCLYLKDVECPSHLKDIKRYAKFVCTCGRIFERAIEKQKSRSGKCLECCKENVGKWNIIHGEADKSKEYKLWVAIKDRCHNEKCKEYKYYGGRGIFMYEPWRKNFPLFLEHIGRAPSKEYSLDRLDNDKGYEPGNVKWATKKEQARNRKSSRYTDYKGERITLAELLEKTGMPFGKIRHRLNKGMNGDEAVEDVLNKMNKA